MTLRNWTLACAVVVTACASTQEVGIEDLTAPRDGDGVSGKANSGGGPTNGGGGEAGSTQTGNGGASTGIGAGGQDRGSIGVAGSSEPANGGTDSGGKPSAGSGGIPSGSGGIASLPGSGGACGLGQKRCAGACVSLEPSNGCSATSCSACTNTLPDNAERSCSLLGQCDFSCNQGFRKSNGACVSRNGTGGQGGADAGSGTGGTPNTDGGEVVCDGRTCRACPENEIGCCGALDNCLCVLPNLTNLCR